MPHLIVCVGAPDLDCAVARRSVDEALPAPDDGLHAVRVALRAADKPGVRARPRVAPSQGEALAATH